MTNESTSLHDSLKALIGTSKHKEQECRAYLKYARDLLVDVTTATFLNEAEEYRGHAGDSDYLIVSKTVDEAGIESNKAYLWEAKSPQCYLFEHDTKSRVRPTKEFISAENQLLHYFEESRGSTTFIEDFNLTHPDNVVIGGVIIGCRRTWVRGGDYDELTLATLFTRALNLRKRYLYGRSGIKIMIWDHILDYLKKQESPRMRKVKFTEAISVPKPNYTIVSSGSK
ncbi:MAG: hypothetical protein MUO85_06070 [candidate division Zixibacteria bacterium]|nr:hypothetical protein [candidate division Zixibacteria bacterium]